MDKSKITPKKLIEMKSAGKKIVCLTAYDFLMSSLLNEAGIDVILVGDSLGMVVQGKKNTLSVTVDDIIYHTRCVAQGNSQALLVADMPFMSYHVSLEEAVRNAGRMVQEGSAEAVKVEGGAELASTVEKIVSAGVPVMGHIGLTPQDILTMGGYFIQGTNDKAAQKLITEAKTLQHAGIFALVLECIPAELGAHISQELLIPTISIGAGPGCDGQILVTHDILGLYKRIKPKFVKVYADLYASTLSAITQYAEEVRNGQFPGTEQSY